MSKKGIFLFLISLIALLCTSTILAEPSKNQPKKFEFSPSIEQLPPKYPGDNPDIVSLYNKLKELFAPKDNFETTKEYSARIENANSSVKNSIYVFTGQTLITGIKYNADQGILSYDFNILFTTPLINILNDFKKEGSYIASNAMGATVEVEKYTFKTYELEMSDSSLAAIHDLSFSLELPPLEAKKLITENDLGFVYLCKLRSSAPNSYSYTCSNYFKLTPTITSPMDADNYNFTINEIINEIWIYNRTTGKIYQKYNLQS
jgi:hypothetical protein